MKTLHAKKENVKRRWLLVDATGRPLGRLASRVASILRGKHTPNYTSHVDTGDFVVVINAGKVLLTGKKLDSKMVRDYSGYPGGLKERPARLVLKTRPEELIRRAVRGMLPRGPLGYAMIRKLKVYGGAEHPHLAQNPQPIDLEGKKK
jgi:large subunit ribosomal protein L13